MSDEMLDVVDKDDNVIGRDTRFNVHHSVKWHRGVHVLVFNSKGNLMIQKRCHVKDKNPNRLDVSVSEHVKAGESYENAAKRGLEEELGIKNAEPKKVVHFRMNYGDPFDNSISVLFKLVYDGEQRIDKNEISSVSFMTVDDVKAILSKEPERFTYWGLHILRWYFKHESELKEIFKIYE